MAYDLIIVINAVFIGLDEDKPSVGNAEWVFLALYLLEILLKLYVVEPRSFFAAHCFWNWSVARTHARFLSKVLTFLTDFSLSEVLKVPRKAFRVLDSVWIAL